MLKNSKCIHPSLFLGPKKNVTIPDHQIFQCLERIAKLSKHVVITSLEYYSHFVDNMAYYNNGPTARYLPVAEWFPAPTPSHPLLFIARGSFVPSESSTFHVIFPRFKILLIVSLFAHGQSRLKISD
jgi:hypothetical protein